MTRTFSLATTFTTATLAVMVSIFAVSAQAQRQHGSGPSVPATHAYGAFWRVGNGESSTLVLKNDDLHNATSVQLSLFGSEGQSAGVAHIQIAPNSVSRTDLSNIAGNQGGAGGLMLQFLAASQVSGKVVISESQNGASAELPLLGGYRYDTESALWAPWWLPDPDAVGLVTLFNSTAQRLVVSPSVTVSGVEKIGSKVVLGPYETKQLRLRDLMGKNSNEISGSLILRYSGPPHALLPALLLDSKSTGFFLAPTFNAKHSQSANQATVWQFPDVLLGSLALDTHNSVSLETYALLSNATANRLSPRLIAYYGVGGRATKTEIPIAHLAPLETRLIDLSQFVGAGLIPPSASHIALSAAHDGVPGDLGIEVFSVSKTNNVVLKSLGTVLPSGVVDSSYWNTETKVCLLPKVLNEGSVADESQVAAYYETPFGVGSYVLPILNVPAGKAKLLTFKQDIQSGIADQSGAIVPAGTSSGILNLAAVFGSESDATAFAGVISTQCNSSEACALPPAADIESVRGVTPTLRFVPEFTCGGGGPPPNAPVITSISPTGGDFGNNVPVTVTGENFDDPGIAVSITGGIKPTSMSVISNTEIQVTFDLGGESTVGAQEARPGFRRRLQQR